MSESDTPRTDAECRVHERFQLRADVVSDTVAHVKWVETQCVAVHVARQLERELTAARAEVEALRADAERYRYLRSRQALEVLTGRGPSAGVWCDMENEMGTLVLVTGNDLDAEVDAALAKEKA
jgi:hypothetical protein